MYMVKYIIYCMSLSIKVSIPHFFDWIDFSILHHFSLSVIFISVFWALTLRMSSEDCRMAEALHWAHPAPGGGWSPGTGAGAPCIADTWAESQEPRNPGPEWRDGSFKVRTPDVSLAASLTYPRSRCSEEQLSFSQIIKTNILLLTSWPLIMYKKQICFSPIMIAQDQTGPLWQTKSWSDNVMGST